MIDSTSRGAGRHSGCITIYGCAADPRRGRCIKISRMQKILIILGLVLLAAGVSWPWLSRLPLGHLPGDIVIDRPGLKVYFPITTMILVSALISLVLWLFRK